MKYSFPIIHTIDDIERYRDAGLIHDAFKRGRRNNGTIVYDYSYMDNQVFPPVETNDFAAIARELRGITFDAASSVLISRPYHKFFNAGEREEVLVPRLPFDHAHHVLEKLDGSMIHAFIAPKGDLAFATRWGITPISEQALAWYSAHDDQGSGRLAMTRLIADGYTPLFEWTSPETIIVVRHERPNLTLTGLRERESGHYVSYADLITHAAALRVAAVRIYDPVSEWESFATRALAETEGEGYVLRFADGHMVKVKNALYARIHKFKSNLARENDAAEIIISGSLDDMLPHMTARERSLFEAYREKMFARLSVLAEQIDGAVTQARTEIAINDARQKQKVFWTKYAMPLGAPFSDLAAAVWNGRATAFEMIKGYVLRNAGTLARYVATVDQLALPRLSFGFDADA